MNKPSKYPALLYFVKGNEEYIVIATSWDEEFCEPGFELSSFAEINGDVSSMPTDRTLE